MNVLVTGGAGFIGSKLVDRLVEKHEVTIIDDLSTGKKELVNDKVEFILGDLKDKQFVKENVKNFDVVWHLAANRDVAEGARDTDVHLKENVEATHNLLEIMRLNNIQKLVFTSTSTVYGEVDGSIPEDYGPLKPISLYGASKLSCEALISAYSEFGINSWIFRLANIIGERSDHGVIPDFIEKMQEDESELTVLGNGEQEKSYMHVNDCVDAILHVYRNTEKDVNIFNIGSEDTIKVKEIADIVKEKINPDADIVYTGGEKGWKGDVPKFHLDISKLKSTGYVPELNSEESVKKVVNSKNYY